MTLPIVPKGTDDDLAAERPGESVIDRIRRRAAAAREAKTIDLEIPGHGGELWVRYGALGPDELSSFAQRGDLDSNLDGLVAAAECILIRGDDGTLKPAQIPGVPVMPHLPGALRLDCYSLGNRLAEFLGLGPDDPEYHDARSAVLYLFGMVPSPHLAAGQQAQALVAWMSGAQADAEADLVGKS